MNGMIQDQLVDYISSQKSLGVSRDAIRAALVGAGWVPADVEDTFKKVEGTASLVSPAVQAAKPAMAASSFPASSSPSPIGNSPLVSGGITKSAVKISEPQMIRVSDLVSASVSPSAVSPAMGAMGVGKTSPVKTNPIMAGAKPAVSPVSVTKSMAGAGQKGGKGILMGTVAIVLIVLLAALSIYLFLQNQALGKSVGGVSTQSADVTSEIASLQSQVQVLTASGTALTAQVASLTAANQDLAMNLSFFVVPPANGGAPVAAVPITVSGTVSGGKPIFTLTTSDGVKTYVKNSSDAGVKAALQPLVGGSAAVQISGTYMSGSPNITVTAVNGVPTTAPATSTPAVQTASSTP